MDRLTCWACINAIMAWVDEPEVLFGEWREEVPHGQALDPVKLAARILYNRSVREG